MYHTSVPCVEYAVLVSGALCMMALVLGGARDVLLKSKFPCRYAYTDKPGLAHAVLSILRVSLACFMRQSHSCMEKRLSVVHIPQLGIF